MIYAPRPKIKKGVLPIENSNNSQKQSIILGRIPDCVDALLGIQISGDRNVYFGTTNELHMQSSHPEDYEKYKSELSNIIHNPDYIGMNTKDNSIEFVKEFKNDNEFVKIAVRVSLNKKYFARSMYVLNNRRVKSFISKGTLKRP